jgi:uncharacterized membrane protein
MNYEISFYFLLLPISCVGNMIWLKQKKQQNSQTKQQNIDNKRKKNKVLGRKNRFYDLSAITALVNCCHCRLL